jgi:hypothetical protein
MIKGVTHAHLGPIWYHSEPSDVPYVFQKSVSWLGLLFAVSYSKPALMFQALLYIDELK